MLSEVETSLAILLFCYAETYKVAAMPFLSGPIPGSYRNRRKNLRL